MKKLLCCGTVLLLIIAGIAVMSFAAPHLQPPAQNFKITLENGKIIEGEIITVTATTISIKDTSVGVIVIARDTIVEIEPPLDEAKYAPKFLPPPPPVPTPRYADQPYVPRSSHSGGVQIGFTLSGGMSNIDGGDFNKVIRDWNTLAKDANDYYDHNNYVVDWKEMKWITNFKAEVFARFGKYFGLGLGVEYLKKSNPGTVSKDWTSTWRETNSNYYTDYTSSYKSIGQYNQSLTIVPLTLNFYGYLPLSDKFDAYINLGPGLYLGSYTNLVEETGSSEDNRAFYHLNGTPWGPDWHETDEWIGSENIKTTCNAIGFHFGAGFNYRLGSNIALFGEAFYRIVKFDKWEGSDSWANHLTETYGYVGGTQYVDNSSKNDTFMGKMYYYEYAFIGKYYGYYWLFEKTPNEDSVRQAEFNISGFSFRAGIKIFFDLGGGR